MAIGTNSHRHALSKFGTCQAGAHEPSEQCRRAWSLFLPFRPLLCSPNFLSRSGQNIQIKCLMLICPLCPSNPDVGSLAKPQSGSIYVKARVYVVYGTRRVKWIKGMRWMAGAAGASWPHYRWLPMDFKHGRLPNPGLPLWFQQKRRHRRPTSLRVPVCRRMTKAAQALHSSPADGE